MANLTVGQDKQFSTISEAIAASQDGDVISIDAGTYLNDFATINTRITLQGVGGMVKMVATVAPPNGKAILVTNTDVAIDRLEFSGTTVPDENGAGIRYQAGHLTISNSFFHHNQNGILAAANTAGSITIRNSEFSHNGIGDGRTHNLYVGQVGSLTIDNSYFHDAVVGHQIKSRALVTTITNSRIAEGQGDGSYSIDLPNGGRATIQNNVIEQGALSGNPVIVSFGVEGNHHADLSLEISGNTISNLLASSSPRLLWNTTSVTATLTDNSVFGLSPNQYASGPAAVSGMTVLTSPPSLDTSPPWAPAPAADPISAPERAPLPEVTPISGTVDEPGLLGTDGNGANGPSDAPGGIVVDLPPEAGGLSPEPGTVIVLDPELLQGGSRNGAVTLDPPVIDARLEPGDNNVGPAPVDGRDTVVLPAVETAETGPDRTPAQPEVSGGRAGPERFMYTSITDSPVSAPDRITDFRPGQDSLVFEGLGHKNFIWLAAHDFTTFGFTQARFDETTSTMELDVNGDGTADMAVVMDGISASMLSPGDFSFL